MNGLFFTATDTGVGKTIVAAAVARVLRGQGRDCRVCKPVATGASQINGRWLSEDTIRLGEGAGQTGEWEQITPWTFAEPVAPPVAARLAGVVLTLNALVAAVRNRYQPGSVVLVEGVGGLLCPLTERETIADLAVALGLPLIVVTRRSLGTLNHTLLTLEAARTRGLSVAGIVVNETAPATTVADRTNVEELARRTSIPILAVVPYQDKSPVDVSPALAQVDWWRLGHASPGS
jgi:dethiobiotin synthetase